MNIVDLINKKRLNGELTDSEVKYLIEGYLSGEIKDYQMSAMLMAITLNGMSHDEVFSLTNYMALSGDKLDLSSLGDNVVDKHSTGGVGDKTTLIISPLVAACGVRVAKMSGRGLGHTGGTIDKLESIPGFLVNMSADKLIQQVKDIGLSITSQTENVALADKKIYALRDVTGTVESIPLIASSIMSKKIALGTKKLILDVKVGSGALMKTREDATELAKLMIEIGKKYGIEVKCILTNMNIPLGNNIGNALEVMEAIKVLKNQEDGNLKDLCVELASWMVSLGLEISYDKAKKMVLEKLVNGDAYNKFLELVKYQGGDIERLPICKDGYQIKAMKSGYLRKIDAYKLGILSMHLGAGRKSKDDTIDYEAGIVINKKINDYINIGDVLMTIYMHKDINNISLDEEFFEITENKVSEEKLVIGIIE